MNTAIQDGVLYCLMMQGPDAWYTCAGQISAEMFDGERRDIFARIERLNQAGQAADPVMVAEGLEIETAQLASSICSNNFVSRHALGSYVEHLRKGWVVSRARDIGAQLADTGDAATARSALLALDSHQVSATVSADGANKRLIEELEHRSTHDDLGLRTGLVELDRLLGGLEPSDLCVVAARPSMGKTAFMLNVAARSGVPCGIFSLEMSTAQLMTRLVAAGGVDYGRLRRPKELTDHDWPRITGVMERVIASGVWINDSGGLTIDTIESEAWRMVKANGVRLLCIDYLQLVTCPSENRFQEVSEISRRLKALAKNLKVPVLALSQMNRSVEKRGIPKPTLSDLRESGQIEQDADQIIFIYRPEVVVEGQRPGEADLILAKNRGGEIGTVTVAWQGHHQRFVNLQRGG